MFARARFFSCCRHSRIYRSLPKWAVAGAFFAAALSGQSQQPLTAPPVQTLHKHVRPEVTNGAAQYVDAVAPESTLNFSIVLTLRNQDQLTSLLGRLYDPTSPDYHHFLSVADFTARFAPSAADYQAVVAFAQANGFTVTSTPANRLVVPVTATVAQINQAFHVTMGQYRHPTENRTFFSPDREPTIALGVPIGHISGLNNFSIPRPHVMRPQQQTTAAARAFSSNGSGPGGAYLASDMRTAYYGSGTLNGTGQAVGLLEFDGYNIDDVNLTFSNAGQSSSVPINNVLLDGATGGPASGNDGAEAEVVLDIVQAIGMAPGLSQVRVYIGRGLDDANILNSMASENIAKQLSCSWGWRPDDPQTDDIFFEEFAAQGQSFFTASGDDGAFDAAISPFFYPGEDAYVTAVGGTHLSTSATDGSWISESAWNSYSGGSGGGISPDGIAIGSWQTSSINASNAGSTTLRNVPDVAMEGDFDNYVCTLGSCYGDFAGTSFAAPRWAGFAALVNQQAVEAGTAPAGGIGFLNPAIYQISNGANYSGDLHDVTVGNNQTANQPVWYSAVSGYDLVTGLGSANGQNLINDLAGPQVPGFWIYSSSGTVAVNQGGSATDTFTVTDAGGFSGDVTLAITSALSSGVTASWGTNPTSGSSVLTVNADSNAAPGTVLLTVVGTSGNLTATTNVKLAVHGPTFTITPSPASLGLNQGATASTNVVVTPEYGFSGNVNLSVSGLPAGVTASWSANPTATSSVLTLSASSSAVGGPANLTITGTSGNLTVTSNLSITVHAPTFVVEGPSSLAIGQGASVSSSIYVYDEYGFTGGVTLSISGLPSGVTASFSPNPTTGYSSLILTASALAATGQYPLTITGTSGNLTETTTLTLGVYEPTFTLTTSSPVNIGQGTSTTANVYVVGQYGFSSNVTLAISGLPSGVTASMIPNPVTGYTTITFTAAAGAALGQYPLTITGTSGSLMKTATLTLGVYTPTFSLTSPSGVTLGQGISSNSGVSVQPMYGFTGSVILSVSGLPSGVTASFLPNPTTSYSTLALVASSTAPLGQYTVTVKGVCGSQTATTTFTLTVAAPGFTVSAPYTASLGQATSTTETIFITPQNGFTGSVNLSVSGLPSGVTASFSPNPTTTPSNLSTLILTASSSAPVGPYTLTITGTSGSLTASATETLTIGSPTFALSGPSSITLGQGGSAGSNFFYINPTYGFTGNVNLSVSGLPAGVTASFSTNPTTYSSSLSLAASSSVATGQYTVTVTGVSGSLTSSINFTLTVASQSFTINGPTVLTAGQGASANGYFYVSSQNGFSGNVNMTVSGLPAGVTASFSPNPTTYSSTITLTAASSAAIGQYPITVLGASGSQTATATLTLSVVAPTFTLNAPVSVNVGQGESSNTSLSINPQNGFTGSVALAVSGLPSGVTGSFSPNPVTSSSTLTVSAGPSTPLGQYPVTITGSSGTQTVTATTTLTVYTPAFTLSSSSVNVGQGHSITTPVTISSLYGFTGNVNLSASGLPSGVTASFSPNPATGTSTLTLSASDSASLGQYPVIITGTSGTQTATTSIVVSVYTPTFTVSTSSLVNVGQGTSATGYVNVNPQYGFAGYVTLSVSGLPSGVTASFSPNPITSSSTITLTASSTATLGQYTAMVTGRSGNQTVTVPLTVGVYTPSFTVSSYSSVSMGPGTSQVAYVYVQGQYNFNGAVNLSVSGLPAGVTATFSPNPTTYSTGLTLVANSTAPVGSYTLTITGTYGAETATTTMPLTINAPAFTVSGPSAVNIGQGNSATAYISIYPQYGFNSSVNLSVSGLPSGVTASFSPNPTNGSSTLTLAASGNVAVGQYPITITGTSGVQTANINLTLGVFAPTFTLTGPSSLTVGQGNSTSSYVYASLSYGFTGSVNLSVSGLPSGVTASFSSNPTTYSTLLTLTASGTAPLGQYTLTITGTSGGQSVTLPVSLTVASPSFGLYASSSVGVGQGGSASSYISVQAANGFSGSVAFSVSGLPPGVTASFSPNPAAYSTNLTFTAAGSATLGQYNVTVTGTSGGLTSTLPLVLQIYPPSFSLSDSYSVTINQGGSGTGTVYIYGQYGFNSPVSLSASGLPAGVTASFSPNPATATSTVTFTASGGATAGPAIVTIVGTSGSASASTTLNLTVNASSFSIADAPSETALLPGASAKSTVSVVRSNGFSGAVNLTIDGLPAGVTASFSSPSTTTSSTLTLTAAPSVTPGTTVATITGTSGAESATEPLQITIRTAPAATTTTLAISAAANPVSSVAAGTPVTLTASVGQGSTSLTTGQVIFCGAAATSCGPGSMLGVAQLTSAATATFTFVPGMGSHGYKAVFLGTNAAAGSSSAVSSLSVTSAQPTTTVITQSGSPGAYRLTATVSGQGAAAPDGMVSFVDTSNANFVLGSATLAPAQTSFSSTASQVPMTGVEPSSVAVGDFNGDGIPDLAVVNAENPGGVMIFLGKGDGTFTAGTPLSPASGTASVVAAADLNQDGKLDLVVGSQNPNSLTIFMGNGDGTFASTSFNPQMSAGPGSIAAGDLNGDGIPDLAVVGTLGSSVNILLGNGDGTFTPAASAPATAGGSRSVQIGDFNGDGVADLVVANQSNNSLTVLLGNGDGTFVPTAVSPATGNNPLSVSVGDFNGDGIQDLAVANGASNSVTVLMGNGDGTFVPTASSPATGSNPISLVVGDFNNDGIQDLGVANYYGNSATVLLGNGNGTFTVAASPTTGLYPFSIAAADFNGDGVPDLLTINYSGASATVLLSKLAQTATASVSNISPVGNGSHTVDASYPGSSYFQSSTSGTVQLAGEPVAPSVSVVPSSSGMTTVQALTVNVVVSGGAGNPTATGSVLLSSGSYTSAGAALSNGSATITIPAGSLAAGSDSLSVTYTPDNAGTTTYTESTGTSSVTVSKAIPTVTVTPSSSGVTTVQGLGVTVSVSGGAGSPAATGSVVLSGGGFTSAATPLAAGSAAINIAAGTMPAGIDNLMVTYTPDAGSSTIYAPASGSSSVTVTKSAPTVVVTPASGSITDLQSLPVTFTVSGGSGTPAATGTVVLTGGGYSSAPTAVGTAIAIPAGALAVGTGTLTLTYTPDLAASPTYTIATGTNSVTITKAAPTVTVNPSSSFISSTQSVNVAVAISGGTGAPVPGGTVTLTGGGFTSPAVSLSNGAASIAINAGLLPAGTDSMSATYTPDSSSALIYSGATGSSSVTVIGAASATLTATASAALITNQQSVTITVSITGAAGQPTGVVTLTSGTYSAQQTIANGAASFSVSGGALNSGANTLAISYSGNVVYNAATAASSVTVAPVIASASTPAVIYPGSAAAATLTLIAGTNYSGTMNLSCTLTTSPQGAQHLPACVLGTAAVPLSAGGSGTDSVTISTTAASSASLAPHLLGRTAGYGFAMALTLMAGIPRRRRLSRLWMLFVVLSGVSLSLMGCGGSGSSGSSGGGGSQNPGTTAGAYVFTLAGTDATNPAITASTTVTVTVQ